jgi:hypothetical protein
MTREQQIEAARNPPAHLQSNTEGKEANRGK